MKRPALFLMLLVCLSHSAYGQTRDGERRKSMAGQVQAVKIERVDIPVGSSKLSANSRYHLIDYFYDERGHLIESVSYSGGKVYRRQVFKYDGKGNIVESSQYKSKDLLIEKTIYTYDAEGKKTESLNYDADGKLSNKTVHLYGSGDRPVERLFYKGEKQTGKETISHDRQGQVIETITYDSRGDIIRKVVTRYDVPSNRAEKSSYGSKGIFEGKTVTTRNAKGNMVSIEYYRPDGSNAWRLEFDHDDKGNVTGEKFANTESLRMRKYDYDYDSLGNWTKKTTSQFFSVDGKPKPFPLRIEYRQYKYYSPNTDQPIAEPEGRGILVDAALLQVQPSYPRSAIVNRISGRVLVEVTVDAEGNVESAKLVSGDSAFRQESEMAAMKWKFRPTVLNGMAIKIVGTISFNFFL